MSNDLSDNLENDSPLSALQSDEARQRWDMFHRAIAHAKQSNVTALQEAEPGAETKRRTPTLSIAR